MQCDNPTCIVIGCYNSRHNSSARYYKVPIEDEVVSRQWYSNTLREDLLPDDKHFVCQEHFDNESFEPNSVDLKVNAIPSLFELEVFHKMLAHQEATSAVHSRSSSQFVAVETNDSRNSVDSPLYYKDHRRHSATTDVEYPATNWTGGVVDDYALQENKSVLINKPPPGQKVDGNLKVLKCQIMGCTNHYMPKKEAVPLYNLPRDPVLARRWLSACRREDVKFNSYTRFKICRDHFQADDFNDDGSLKQLAVPSVFSERSIGLQTQLRNLNLTRRSKSLIVEDVCETATAEEPDESPLRIVPLIGSPTTNEVVESKIEEPSPALSPEPVNTEVTQPTDLNMTCEDDKLSHSQLLAFKAQMFSNPAILSMAVAEGVSLDWIIDQNTPAEELNTNSGVEYERSGGSVIRSGGRNSSLLQGVKRHRRKKAVQKQTIYEFPEPTAKASIPFLEPAFKEPLPVYPKNVPIPRLKPGAVRTREEGLEVHLERTFRQTLKKYYDRKWTCTNSQANVVPVSCRCSICHEQLPDNIALAAHLCQHIESRDGVRSQTDHFGHALSQTVCTYCRQTFRSPFELIFHLDTCHMHEIKEYQCRICEQKHGSILELVAHLNLCHCGLEMPYRCDECGFRTSFYVDALFHIATNHRGESKFFCPFCLKTMAIPQLSSLPGLHNSSNAYLHLLQHYNKVDGEKVTASKCKHCRKCVLHLRMIKDHIRRDHPNIVAGAKASYFSDEDEDDERFLLASGAITAIAENTEDPSTIAVEEFAESVPGEESSSMSTLTDSGGKEHMARKRKKYIEENPDIELVGSAFNGGSFCGQGIVRQQRGNRLQKFGDDLLIYEPYVEDNRLMGSILESTFDDVSSVLVRDTIGEGPALKLRCIECGRILGADDVNHFKKSHRCAFCPYSSSCEAAFSVHEHGHHEQTLYTLGECPPRPQYIFQCGACGLETVDADLMAFHMATACVGGEPSDNSLAGSVEGVIDARAQCSDCSRKGVCIPLGV